MLNQGHQNRGGGRTERKDTTVLSCRSMWLIKQQCMKRRKGDSPERIPVLSTAAPLLSGIWKDTSTLPPQCCPCILCKQQVWKRGPQVWSAAWKYNPKVLYTNSWYLFERGIVFLPQFHWKRTEAQIDYLPFPNSKYKSVATLSLKPRYLLNCVPSLLRNDL